MMRRGNYIFCVFVGLLMYIELFSQTTIADFEGFQQSNVGLVDEFIKRFNGIEMHPQISTQDTAAQKKNLASLIALDQMQGDRDSVLKQAIRFVDIVVQNSAMLNYNDSNWVAFAKCHGKLLKSPVVFNLYLNVEHRQEDMYKWVIAKAEGQCFNVHPIDTSSKIMLYPDDHETRFISLNRMTTEQPYNVLKFMSKGSDYDATSVFMYLVHSGNLIIDYVENLEFIFTKIPGYVFHINYLEREAIQSGWLITKFYPATDVEKAEFLESLHLYSDDETLLVDNKTSQDESIETAILQKDVFNIRVAENIKLLKDYIAVIQCGAERESIQYYKLKIMNMFSPDAVALIYQIKENKTVEISIPDLCELLSQKQVGEVLMASIAIPIWDNKLEMIDSKINIGRLKANIISLKEGNILKFSEQQLIVRKEITEDGYEWMPFFGNIYMKFN